MKGDRRRCSDPSAAGGRIAFVRPALTHGAQGSAPCARGQVARSLSAIRYARPTIRRMLPSLMSPAVTQPVLPKWRRVIPVCGIVLAAAAALLWIALHALWISGYQETLRVDWMRYNLETTHPSLDFNTGGVRPVLVWWR